MTSLQLTLASVNQTPLDFTGNAKRILDAIFNTPPDTKAPNLNSNSQDFLPQLLCFPELSITGYGCEDTFLMPYVVQYAADTLLEIADATAKVDALIAVGLPFLLERSLYNTMAVLHKGSVVAIVPKSPIAGDGSSYEQRWFHHYAATEPEPIRSLNEKFDGVPFGPVLLDFYGHRIAFDIGTDARYPRLALNELFASSVDLILNPTALPFSIGRYELHRNQLIAAANQFRCVYASVNLLGNESGSFLYDGSRLVAGGDSIISESERFSFQPYQLSQVSLDPKTWKQGRNEPQYTTAQANTVTIPSPADKTQKATIGFGLDIAQTKTPNQTSHYKNDSAAPLQSSGLNTQSLGTDDYQFLEFSHAVSLGLFDYMRKIGAKGYTISLSGGADSITCAILCERMIRRATALDNDCFEGLDLTDEKENLPASMIHTMYQGTDNNSEATQKIAYEVAHELKLNHHSIHIQSAVDQSVETIETAIGRKLTWQSDDLALQNIQARSRNPLIWMLANVTRTILIATGNRSESAVGYCTMDGDTVGGLAPIGGIDKAFLLEWLNFMYRTGDEFGKIKSLQNLLSRPPTAELRPPDANQTDEKDLMPYSLLQRIERLAFEACLSPDEIVRTLIQEKSESESQNETSYTANSRLSNNHWTKIVSITEAELKQAVARFFTMFTNSQWKRQRFAVSFQVDSYNLSPQGYLRYPVISKSLIERSNLNTSIDKE